MRSPFALVMLACTIAVYAGTVTPGGRVEAARDEPLAPASIEATLERLRADARLPALAAAIVTPDQTIAAAVGVRRAGDRTPVTRDDKFHVGSITKSITVTVAATLVEEGAIRWDTTIGEAFPDLRAVMDARYAAVTLEMLLAHRAGVADRTDSPAWKEALRRQGTPREQRERFVRSVLSMPPASEPGSTWSYANVGYAISGVMLERAANESYESLVRRRVVAPLELWSLGFGPPATPGKIDQPWRHEQRQLNFSPVPPGPTADNPPAIAPAGTVHMSLLDLARYARFHLRARCGEPALFSKETAEFVYRPRSDNGYGLGWLTVMDDPRACGPAVWHNGSNGSFYAYVWLAPARNLAVVVAINAEGSRVRGVVDETIAALVPVCPAP